MTWNEIKLIEGKQLQRIGRAVDIIWLAIGEKIERMIAGKMRSRGTYAVHISCAFRVSNVNHGILFTGDDKYCPKPGLPDDENFHWDNPGDNLSDYKAQLWFSSNNPIYIRSAEISRFGDLKIIFNNGDLLEAFVSYSEEESWRFFEPGMDTSHLVISGNKIERV